MIRELIALKYFRLIQTVANEGSLAKAADQLYLTQSALSHQLRELETQLGAPVFNRVNKTLVLTEIGRMILDAAGVVLSEVEKVNQKIDEHLRGESGTIRIGAESNTCYHWLPQLIKKHQKEFPNVSFRLQPNGLESPLKQLMEGHLDLAIVYRKNADKNLHYDKLLRDDVVALIPEDHPLASKKYLTPEDFAAETYITHSHEINESIFFEEFLQPEGVTPNKVMHIQLTETVMEMVSEGLGVSVMARWLVAPYIENRPIKMIQLGQRGLKRTWHLATLKKESESRPLSRFLEMILSDLNSMPNQ